MAEINFLPVCSNCNKVIHGEIDYEEIDTMDIRLFIHKHWEITPRICPYCGEFFETITMPTKLPFRSAGVNE